MVVRKFTIGCAHRPTCIILPTSGFYRLFLEMARSVTMKTIMSGNLYQCQFSFTEDVTHLADLGSADFLGTGSPKDVPMP